jgi:hypothetical protein
MHIVSLLHLLWDWFKWLFIIQCRFLNHFLWPFLSIHDLMPWNHFWCHSIRSVFPALVVKIRSNVSLKNWWPRRVEPSQFPLWLALLDTSSQIWSYPIICMEAPEWSAHLSKSIHKSHPTRSWWHWFLAKLTDVHDMHLISCYSVHHMIIMSFFSCKQMYSSTPCHTRPRESRSVLLGTLLNKFSPMTPIVTTHAWRWNWGLIWFLVTKV